MVYLLDFIIMILIYLINGHLFQLFVKKIEKYIYILFDPNKLISYFISF